MQIEANSLETLKNNQTTMPVWFDMREPVLTFTGRTEVLKKLHQTLQDATDIAVISQTTSVSGFGGIGKSELSRKYAIEYQAAYDGNLIWINSETHESLKDSFVRLSEQLKLPFRYKKIESVILNIYKIFGNGKCLFIFDNAEEFEIIKEFLPISLPSNIQKPHILITSRNQNWNLVNTGDMKVINLEHFTSEESLHFIKNALKIQNNSSDDEIKDLANLLNNFPLALGQAVAYIIMKNKSEERNGRGAFEVRDYLKEYQDETLNVELLEHRHRNSQYNKTVLTTWNITLKNIAKENEDAIKIIEIMAYLASDSINKETLFSKLIKDQTKRENAIDLILKYSIINFQGRVLSIHRLVQELIRMHLKDNNREKLVLENALELLGLNPNRVETIHLISVWGYACDYGQIIDEFFFKYKSFGDKKTTPFHLMVESDNVDTVKKILNHFKKLSNENFQEILNSKKYYYQTPLFISIQQNNLAMVRLLIKFGAKIKSKTFVKAIFFGYVDMVKYFYPNNDEYLLNAKFYFALNNENVESLNNLLKELTNEQFQNIMALKLTNVDPKLLKKSPPLVTAAQSGNLEIVKLFMNYMADINISASGHGTPLYATLRRGRYEVFKFLIENGANCNAVDRRGDTLLHACVRWGRLEMAKYLVNNNKCDLNAINNKGETALNIANKYGRRNMIEYLRGKN